jgi:hypothetical protein
MENAEDLAPHGWKVNGASHMCADFFLNWAAVDEWTNIGPSHKHCFGETVD